MTIKVLGKEVWLRSFEESSDTVILPLSMDYIKWVKDDDKIDFQTAVAMADKTVFFYSQNRTVLPVSISEDLNEWVDIIAHHLNLSKKGSVNILYDEYDKFLKGYDIEITDFVLSLEIALLALGFSEKDLCRINVVTSIF